MPLLFTATVSFSFLLAAFLSLFCQVQVWTVSVEDSLKKAIIGLILTEILGWGYLFCMCLLLLYGIWILVLLTPQAFDCQADTASRIVFSRALRAVLRYRRPVKLAWCSEAMVIYCLIQDTPAPVGTVWSCGCHA